MKVNNFHKVILEKYRGSLFLTSLKIDLIYGIKKHKNISFVHTMTIEDNPDIDIYLNCGYEYVISDKRSFLIHSEEWSKVKSDIKSLLRDKKLNKLIDD